MLFFLVSSVQKKSLLWHLKGQYYCALHGQMYVDSLSHPIECPHMHACMYAAIKYE